MTAPDPRFVELDRLERTGDSDDVGRMIDVMADVAETVPALGTLVQRYATSRNPLIASALAFVLSRAAWNWDIPEVGLCRVVLDFIAATERTTDYRALSGGLNALHGLRAREILEVGPEDQSRLADFFIHCLGGHDLVRDAALDVLHHLWVDRMLEHVLSPAGLSALKDRLARLAAEEGDKFRDGLAQLEPFWSSE